MPQSISLQRRLAQPFHRIAKSLRQLRGVRLWAAGAVLLLAAAALVAALAIWSRRDPPRVACETLRLSWSPPSETAWTTENAYPQLKFFEPTCIAFARDGSGRVLVLERRGTVRMFQDDPQADATTEVLDISEHVWRTPYEDDGAVAIALHPEFGQKESANKDFFYLLYTARIAGRRYDRLSRFTLRGTQAGDELVMIDQYDENIWHNGGGLVFGPDGFLYVGVGDEGTNGDGLKNGQRIDRDLFCGILRIDVDQRGGDLSHPPPRQPDTGKTTGYYIPNDNPFVGVTGALEEFWAHGLRNPYRIAFDAKNGRLWAADVGHLRREEIDLIQRGDNYGWSYREGTLPFADSYLNGKAPASSIELGEAVAPVWEYPHLNGNNCVIGGFVYRGAKHPQLDGKFIYADNGSGRVWALGYDGENATTNEELLALPVSSKTGIASVQPDAQGEPLIVILGETDAIDGTIRRVVAAEESATTTLPGKLSETGIFADVTTLAPNPGVIPYEVNASQSAGAARIRRWISVPGDGHDPDGQTDRIGFSDADAWTFPTGTVFVQHFDLPAADATGRSSWRPVETRILVRHSAGGVYALSYRWNDAGTDADLVTEPAVQSVTVADGRGAARAQNWRFLDRQTCLACHNANARFVLGVNARQLNRSVDRGESNNHRNQLLDLSESGYFCQALADADLAALDRLVAPDDERADLALRARSYLDVNCAACHRDGGARAIYFAQFPRTADAAALCKPPSQGDFGIPEARIVVPGDPFRSVLYYRLAKLGQGRMPFVGAHDLDREGLSLVRQWIEQMAPAAKTDPRFVAQDESIERLKSGAASSDEVNEFVGQLLSDTRGTLALWQAIYDGAIAEPLRSEIIAKAAAYDSPAARDLFEWFVEPDARTQRLGTDFDPLAVLQHAGDAQRGRALFANTDVISCKSCHATEPEKQSIGPSLWGIGRKYRRAELLRHIAEPSAAIDPKYAVWMVETARGRVLRGLLVRQSDDEVVLRDAQGQEIHIAAADVDYLQKQPQSLMPDHLLQSLTPAQAADLLAYLGALR